MSEEHIYDHIEDCGRYQAPLGHPEITLEGGAKISAGLRHYRQYIPVVPEEAEDPRAYSINHQNIEAVVVVQGIIGFMKI